MGEIADAILNGDMTEDGEWIGLDLGHPVGGIHCEEVRVFKNHRYADPPGKGKTDCRICGKRVKKGQGIKDHLRVVHGK